jgi:para-nitrobenzyl esterase
MKPRSLLILLLGTAVLAALIGVKVYPHFKRERWRASPDAFVRVETGVLQGGHPAPDVLAWLGIPYARPPVGDLRWRPPVPATSWEGVRRATSWGARCPQPAGPRWKRKAAEWQSEDCLHLNVWAPVNPGKYPVIFYVHGGGNNSGTASEEYLDGTSLVRHGIVLVTIDYRLGIFGFLRSAELDAESGKDLSGNYGLLDILEGLRWVHRNIASFGGDPDQVTLMGGSAGASNTSILMTSPQGQGLFQRAILQSGQALGMMPVATHAESIAAWAVAAEHLSRDPNQMRAASTGKVMAAAAIPANYPEESTWGLRSTSIDGWLIPERPSEAWAAGREAAIPLLIGYNLREIYLFHGDPAGIHKAIQRSAGERFSKLERIYAQDDAAPMGGASIRFETDRDFHCPAVHFAEWHASHGKLTFAYRFDRAYGNELTAIHGLEIPYVFGRLPNSRHPQEDAMVANAIESYFAAFAKGDLNTSGSGLPMWPSFEAATGSFVVFPLLSVTPEVHHDFSGDACRILTSDVLPGSREHDSQ